MSEQKAALNLAYGIILEAAAELFEGRLVDAKASGDEYVVVHVPVNAAPDWIRAFRAGVGGIAGVLADE